MRLLHVLCVTVPLTAQVSDFQVMALPHAVEARVAGVASGAAITFCLGIETAKIPLSGGVTLGLLPLATSPVVIADENGVGFSVMEHPVVPTIGLSCLVQAVVIDRSAAVTVSKLRTVDMPQAGDVIDVIVLIGQSNAEGYADIEELQADLRGRHPMTRIWNHAQFEWQPVEAGVNSHAVGSTPFFGPEVGIADYVRSGSRPVWLVKFTMPASAMGPLSGEWNEWSPQAEELYPAVLQRIDAAAAAAVALGYTPRVRLVCTMQGETDCVFPALADAYEHHLMTFCVQLRADLLARGLGGAEQPLFRIGLVSPGLSQLGISGVGVVRTAQRVVAKDLARGEAIETAQLALQPDGVHFAAAGTLALGRSFAGPGWQGAFDPDADSLGGARSGGPRLPSRRALRCSASCMTSLASARSATSW